MLETLFWSSVLLLLNPPSFSRRPTGGWQATLLIIWCLLTNSKHKQAAHPPLGWVLNLPVPRDSKSYTLSSPHVSLGTSWGQESRGHLLLIPLEITCPPRQSTSNLKCGGNLMTQGGGGPDKWCRKCSSLSPSLDYSISSSGTSHPHCDVLQVLVTAFPT